MSEPVRLPSTVVRHLPGHAADLAVRGLAGLAVAWVDDNW